jgi:hypothetical protein
VDLPRSEAGPYPGSCLARTPGACLLAFRRDEERRRVLVRREREPALVEEQHSRPWLLLVVQPRRPGASTEDAPFTREQGFAGAEAARSRCSDTFEGAVVRAAYTRFCAHRPSGRSGHPAGVCCSGVVVAARLPSRASASADRVPGRPGSARRRSPRATPSERRWAARRATCKPRPWPPSSRPRRRRVAVRTAARASVVPTWRASFPRPRSPPTRRP